MIGGHELIVLPRVSSTALSNIMGANRNGSGQADDARGLSSAEKYPTRSVSPNSIARVRRNLFGSNPLATRTFLDNELSKLRSRQNEKWNFDFTSGKPLNNPNGKYIWEAVSDKTTSFNNAGRSQKYIQTKMTDYMGKRKISPTSSQDKSKSIKTDVHSSRTSCSGKSSSHY